MPDKARSLRALDAFNFFNAGIQTGLGPFIAIFYKTALHWNPGQIGLVLSVQSLAGIGCQTAMGHAVDETEHKQLVSAIAAFVVMLGCFGIVYGKGMAIQIAAQAAIGVAVTVFPATTSAFALGLVGKKDLSNRVARNESFTHAGNVIFACLAAAVGLLIALKDIFLTAALFASGMAFSAFVIRAEDINYEAARAGDQGDQGGQQDRQGAKRKTWRDLVHDPRILVFTAVVVLFNVGNASALPLVGQLLSKDKRGAVWQTAACVVVAECVMVFVAWVIGKRVDRWGRKPVFIIAFAILAARNLLTIVSHSQGYLISLQSLDGAAAAIYGVLLTLVAADLARGSGRFNFLQGGVQAAMGLGAFLSNLFFGYIARAVSFNASFIGLAIAATAGGLLYLWKMPETKSE